MKISIRNILAIIAVAVFLLGSLESCKNPVIEKDNLRSVRLISPEKIASNSSVEYAGIIEEGKNVNASFMTDGKIKNLLVKEGDRVRKGQLLAIIDDEDYQIGVNQLKAQYHQMVEEKKRMDEMFARHNIAPNDYEKFSAGFEQLQLQVKLADNKLGYTKLLSPSDGYISEKFIEVGELVGAGTPIFKITDDSNLIVSVDMPVKTYLNRNNILSIAGYSPAFSDQPIPLKIESFTPDPSNNMFYKMKLIVPFSYAKELSPGMNIRVEIESENGVNDGYKVQSRSVFDDNGENYLWVYNPVDSSIYKKKVHVVGIPEGNKMTVSGLSGDEQIVETGVKQLYEGEKVNISNNADFGL